jgi:TonB-linked SusC/RagA family outer membrane protein
MKNTYILRTFLTGCLILIAATGSEAQEAAAPGDSTFAAEQHIPGHLFASGLYGNTGASATVAGSRLSKTIAPNLINTFAGQLPGLSVRQGNGTPGADNTGWLIRGIGSYGYGRESESKLFVDGFEVNSEYLVFLAPSEIESVTVLKDAAALVTFGMKGSNGVIWIETKRGKAGAPTISAHVTGSLQTPVNTGRALSSAEYATLYNQAVSNDNAMAWTPRYSEEDLAAYRSGAAPDVNWFGEVLKNRGSYLNADVSFNGGNRTARYHAVLDYADHRGLLNVDRDESMSNLKMDRFNLRTNLDLNLFEFLEAKIDLSGRVENRKSPNYDTDALMDNLAGYPSNIYNVYDDEAQENFSGTALYSDNPVGSVKGLGWRSSRLRILQGNFMVKEKLDFITPGLYLQQGFSFYSRSTSTYNKTRNYARYSGGATTTTDENTSLVASGYGSEGMNDWKQAVVTAGYSAGFGVHALRTAANFHLSDYKGDGRFGYKYHYLNYSGKVNYSYDNRYAVEAGFSYFGSDSYAPGKRFGFYPALSAAWIISNEGFMQSHPAVGFLKLRVSAGKTGGSDSGETGNLSGFNSNGRFLYEQYYYYTGGFNSGNTTPYQWNSGLAPLFIANKDAGSETSMKYNAGLEIGLLGKLNLTADLFLDKRSNILTFNQTLMGYYGHNYYLSNIGRMTNRGFELSAVYTDKAGQIDYSLSASASYARNIIDYSGEIPPAYAYNAYTGRPYGTQVGLVADGFYQLNDFNADGSLKAGLPVSSYGKVQPGDLKYKDLDADGFIDDTDVTETGGPACPPLNYAFGGQVAWKGFDIGVMFRGAYGASVNLMDYGSRFIAFMDNRNAFAIAKGAWAYYPEQGIDTRKTATYPRLSAANNENNYRNSSFWIRHNDYLRVQYAELGYSFVPALWKTKDISRLRIFLNATNPLTWSSLLKDFGMDPESSFGYPSLRSFTAGVSLIF